LLRESFDAAFAAAPATAGAATTGLLAVRIGTTAAAVRLDDIAGLFADQAITPMPMAPPELLGLAGFRGSVVPVFDLATLLGLGAAADGHPRWCVLAAGERAVALAFHGFDGYRRVPVEAVHRAAPGTELPTGRDVVAIDGHPRSIVEIPSLVDAIAARARRPGGGEEHRR
jgi:purine-binding chemotaxis protein CheW